MSSRAEGVEPAFRQGRFALGVALGICIVLTALSGVAIGWWAKLAIAAYPSAQQQSQAAGAYGAAALVLMLGAAALVDYGTTRWQTWMALTAAAVMLWLTASAAPSIGHASPSRFDDGSWVDGALWVLACPWTWPLIVVGMAVVSRRSLRSLLNHR